MMTVLCNDCLEKSEVKFHVMGGKCSNCKSYNTTQVGGLKNQPPETGAAEDSWESDESGEAGEAEIEERKE